MKKIFFTFALATSFVFSVPSISFAQTTPASPTIAELQAQVAQLIKIVLSLQQAIAALIPAPGPQTPPTLPPIGMSIPKPQSSEIVKCLFEESKTVQECYASNTSGRYACSGANSCTIQVKGEKYSQLTWESSCGGYAYTTIDGERDYRDNATFDCSDNDFAPMIRITSPNGGEHYSVNSGGITVQYTSLNIAGKMITAGLYGHSGGNVLSVRGVASNNGSINIEFNKKGDSGVNRGEYQITLCAENVGESGRLCDYSDNYFTLD